MGGTRAGRAHVASVVAFWPGTLARGRGLLERVNTTPGRLRLASIVLVAALTLTWAAVMSVLVTRQSAARAVGEEAAPLLLATTELHAALADADATASRGFLEGGVESEQLRAQYEDDIDAAAEQLAAIGGHADNSADVREAVNTIIAKLADYTARIETARANGRQGFVIAAAYLRDASRIMTDEILPAATELYEIAARRMDDGYRSGTSNSGLMGIAVAVIVALGLFVAVQIWVARWSNRTLNLGLLGATFVVLGLVAWALILFGVNQDRLVRAQREGSDAVLVASAARILALRAHSDANLALIERGTGDVYVDDFMDVTGRLGGSDGLLDEFAGMADDPDTVSQAIALRRSFREFRQNAWRVRWLDGGGRYDAAVAHSIEHLGPSAERLDALFSRTIDSAHRRLTLTARGAGGGFTLLATGATLIAAAGVVLVLYGLQQRIQEYR
jgi:hypothetical protein